MYPRRRAPAPFPCSLNSARTSPAASVMDDGRNRAKRPVTNQIKTRRRVTYESDWCAVQKAVCARGSSRLRRPEFGRLLLAALKTSGKVFNMPLNTDAPLISPASGRGKASRRRRRCSLSAVTAPVPRQRRTSAVRPLKSNDLSFNKTSRRSPEGGARRRSASRRPPADVGRVV
ncbi:hypothetical protein EVAR_47668_1 [Eumeta japonica]|uniref:Uncharacterized protein n=1 Tax=Eumeta variegata TaxID=151549 RepID=A0A4C1Y1I2_EUMVA|nr:hypothetical protein EVAR_47668_1 [Eumeta japonica]